MLGFTEASSQKARGLSSEKELKEKCQEIVDDFTNGSSKKAFEKMRKHCVLSKDVMDNLESKTIDQLIVVKETFGEPIGIVFVKDESIKEVLYKAIYVIKLNNTALRFYFL